MQAPLIRFAFAAAVALAAQAAQAQLYLRADLGYSKAADAGIRDKNFAVDGLICAPPACAASGELNHVGKSPVFSAGLGWRINPSVRTDLTVAYRGGYQLEDSDAFSDFKADITSTNLMLAGYYDMSLGPTRPYVGAGVGWAQNKIGTVTNTGAGFSTESPGGTWSGLAWSLMAGLGIPLGSRLTLDVAYRYINLGKIESQSGALTCAPAACPGATYSGLTGNLRAHELMVGFRF